MADFCNMFRGNLGQTTPEFHKIVTKDKIFASMGLSSFTSGTLFETLKNNNKFLSGMGNTQEQVYQSIMGRNWVIGSEPCFMYWDNVRKGYFHKRLVDYGGLWTTPPKTNIENFITANNELVNGDYDGNELVSPFKERIEALDDCKTSMSGCLSWTVPLLYNFTPAAPIGQGCVHRINVPLKMYFYDKDYLPDNKRHVVNRGAPRFAAVPSLAFGKPFSPAATREGGGDAGDFAPPEEGGVENPRNSVNAEMDIQFNPNTGKWEGGTKQILARLLTPLPGVPLSRLDPMAIDNYTKDDMQNPNKDTNPSARTEGKAVPMQVHNGNPNLFGPIWSNKKCEENKKEVLKVVNRSKKSFPAGDIVMLSFIGNEWIVQDLGEDPVGMRQVGIGKWGFTYLVSNSDSYFHDNRYKTLWNGVYEHLTGVDVTDKGSQYYQKGYEKVRQQIKPSEYEGYFEKQYYYDIMWHDVHTSNTPSNTLSDVNGTTVNDWVNNAAMNLGYDNFTEFALAEGSGLWEMPNFVGSKDGYYQVSSFDMMGWEWGGTNSAGNFIGRTRPDMRPDGTDVPDTGEGGQLAYPFWGAVFPDGYDRVKLNELKTKSPGPWPRGWGANVMHGGGISATIADITKDRNIYGGIFSYFDNDGKRQVFADQLGVQIPADIALNASPSGSYGLPTLDVRRIIDLANVDSGPANGVDKDFVGGQTVRVVDNFNMTNRSLPKRIDQYFEAGILSNDGAVNTNLPNNGITTLPTSMELVKASGFGHQTRHQWVGKLDTELTGRHRIYESFWDLKPQNATHLIFMPMTAEYASQYDVHMSLNHYENIPGHSSSNLTSMSPNRFNGVQISASQYALYDASRKNFAGWTTGPGLTDNAGFLPNVVTTRNRRIGNWSLLDAGNATTVDFSHFRIPSSLSPPPVAFQSNLGSNQNIQAYRPGWPCDLWLHNGAPNHGHKIWYEQPYPPSYTEARNNAGCVGIVAARANMTVNSNEIVFETQSQLGVSNYGSMTGGTTTRWGGDGDNVDSFGTTALHVRVFDGWPQDQTLYDPRYMAVMHFNEGSRLHPIVSNLTDSAAGKPTIWKKDDSYSRNVDSITWTRLDFRIPTYGVVPSTNNSPADYQYDNEIVAHGTELQKSDAIRPSEEWRVNPVRRGMLLSKSAGGFKYKRRTIGLNEASIMVAVDDQGNAMNGKNFVVGEQLAIVGGQGTGAVLRVTSVDSNGGVTGLKWDKDNLDQDLRGYGYQPEDFGDDTVTPPDLGTVQIIADKNDPTSTGEDLLAYITKGVVWDYVDTDAAPSERSAAAQRASLSNNNGNGNEDSGNSELTGRSKNGRGKGQYRTSVAVAEDHKLPTEVTPLGNFDIFLHFHNDVTHTFAEGQGGQVAPINPIQQFIELTISSA